MDDEGRGPYLGPWNNPTAPVLVIGNTFDPATSYASSERMAQEMCDGHFVIVTGFGHTELLNPSQCAKDYVAAYLIDGTVPPDGAQCAPDRPPFAQGVIEARRLPNGRRSRRNTAAATVHVSDMTRP